MQKRKNLTKYLCLTLETPKPSIVEKGSFTLRSDLRSFTGHIGTPDFSNLVAYVYMMNMRHILHSFQNVE
jgi:hypothetical protein